MGRCGKELGLIRFGRPKSAVLCMLMLLESQVHLVVLSEKWCSLKIQLVLLLYNQSCEITYLAIIFDFSFSNDFLLLPSFSTLIPALEAEAGGSLFESGHSGVQSQFQASWGGPVSKKRRTKLKMFVSTSHFSLQLR